jgi:hypothetical protein
MKEFNAWLSLGQKMIPGGMGVLDPEKQNQIDQIQQMMGKPTPSQGALTPAGFIKNPTPKGNQPQVVPPPRKKDPFIDAAQMPNAFVDEVPAVMDEMNAMPELDIQVDDGPTQQPDYADDPMDVQLDIDEPQATQNNETIQPPSQPIGTLPQEIVPQQNSLISPSQVPLTSRQMVLAQLDKVVNNYADQQKLQQDEIDRLKEGLNRYESMDQGIDFTPLAALSDAWFGGNLTSAAKQIAPPSADERAKNIQDMQLKIAEAQGRIPKDQLEAMKMKLEQLSYMDQRDTALEVAKINAKSRGQNQGASGVRAGIAQDRLASAAADVIDKDPLVKKYYDMSEQADRDVALLDTPLLTYQNLNEVQIGLARVIAGGGQSAVSREEKTEFKTLGLELANLKQKLTGSPQDVASPEIVAQLRHIGERLKQGLQKNAYNRANKLAEGRGKVYKNNPIAAEVLRDKVESYKPIPSESEVTGSFSAEKKARLEELRKKLGK